MAKLDNTWLLRIEIISDHFGSEKEFLATGDYSNIEALMLDIANENCLHESSGKQRSQVSERPR